MNHATLVLPRTRGSPRVAWPWDRRGTLLEPLTTLWLFNAQHVAPQSSLLPHYRALRGLIALEQGDTDRALTLLEEALALEWKPYRSPEMTLAEKYVRLLKEQRRK